MNERNNIKIGRFDQVTLITTKNVKYLSAAPGSVVSPSGVWSVVGAVDGKDLLCTKEGAVIRIPASDVVKQVGYDVESVISKLTGLDQDGQIPGHS
jgi:hypothetical protein